MSDRSQATPDVHELENKLEGMTKSELYETYRSQVTLFKSWTKQRILDVIASYEASEEIKASIRGTNPYALDDFWLMEQSADYQKGYVDTLRACALGKDYVYDTDDNEAYTKEWMEGHFQALIDVERGYSRYEDGYVKAASKPSPQLMMSVLYYQWCFVVKATGEACKYFAMNINYDHPAHNELRLTNCKIHRYSSMNCAHSKIFQIGYFGYGAAWIGQQHRNLILTLGINRAFHRLIEMESAFSTSDLNA